MAAAHFGIEQRERSHCGRRMNMLSMRRARSALRVLRGVGPRQEVKDFDAASWFMLVAPGKTPKDIIAKLHGELRVIGNDRDMRNEFVRLGLVPVESLPPDELKRFVASEIARWANVVREAGLAGSE
jgi:hypothetical protein